MAQGVLRVLFCGLVDIIPTPNVSTKRHKDQPYTDIYTGERRSAKRTSDPEVNGILTTQSHNSNDGGIVAKCAAARRSASSGNIHHSKKEQFASRRVKSITRSDINRIQGSSSSGVSPSTPTSTRTSHSSDRGDGYGSSSAASRADYFSTSTKADNNNDNEHLVASFDPIQENVPISRSYTNVSQATNESNYYNIVIDASPNYVHGISSV